MNLNLNLLGAGVAALSYAAFAVYFASRIWVRRTSPGNALSFVLLAALVCSAAWASFSLVVKLNWWPVQVDWLVPAADWLRYACWFWFVLLLLQPKLDQVSKRRPPRFADLAYASLASSLLMLILREFKNDLRVDLLRASAFTALGLAVV
ncbi:MAG: hypothetical protein IV107_16710, partial [Paucibacter sp.]|nr:hypothetical protein [Roseateles sp.]